MRFSAATCLALPLLGVAQEAPLDQYKAQFQNFLDNFGSYIPNPNKHDPIAAAEAKAGAQRMDILTVNNWKETLYGPVAAGATVPEDWWVMVTGGNKTCFGHCGKVEAAFNETAAKLALLPGAPHVAYLNCEAQPILCNSWSVGAGSLWIFEMLPPPAAINIYQKRLNLTSTTSQDLMGLYESGTKEGLKLHEGFFHPFDGPLARNGLSLPAGYVLWAFNLVPSWLFMLVVSFISRTIMSNRVNNTNRPRGPAGAAGGGPAR